MLGKFTTIAAASAILVTAQVGGAGAGQFAGATSALDSFTAANSSAFVHVHSKRCKFVDSDGYTYKDHCPHGVKKGSRKKRAGFGALVGAGLGAAIGAGVGGGRGAAIGAGIGAGVGAVGGATSVRKCWYRDSNGRKFKARCRQ